MKSVAIKNTTSEESNLVSAPAAVAVADVAADAEFVEGGVADVAVDGEFVEGGVADVAAGGETVKGGGGDVAAGGEFVGGGGDVAAGGECGGDVAVGGEEEKEGREDYEEEEEEEEEYENQLPLLSADSELYLVHAIRRKRVIKGQVQYLVKWLGWPESANTWEPPEHLTSVRDLIEAFEESSASVKQRKRRSSSVSNPSQLKKRQERSNTPYSLRRIRDANAENHTQSAPPNDANIPDPCAFPQAVLFADEIENNGEPSSLGKAKVSDGSGSANPPELSKSNEENEYDPKLCELKAASTSGHGAADRPPTQVQEGNVATDNGQVDGRLKGVHVEQESDSSIGAKKKKSTEDSHAGEPVTAEKPIGTPASTFVPVRAEMPDFVWHKSQKKKKKVLATPVYDITKIIKPLGCSPTLSGELCVTFIASRWDGTEVMVDNGYLKLHHPELLIEFYERRINYNTL